MDVYKIQIEIYLLRLFKFQRIPNYLSSVLICYTGWPIFKFLGSIPLKIQFSFLIADGTGMCQLNESAFEDRSLIVKRYIGANIDWEKQALYALQHLMQELEHPTSKCHFYVKTLFFVRFALALLVSKILRDQKLFTCYCTEFTHDQYSVKLNKD